MHHVSGHENRGRKCTLLAGHPDHQPSLGQAIDCILLHEGKRHLLLQCCDVLRTSALDGAEEKSAEVEFISNVPAGNIAVNGGPMVRASLFLFVGVLESACESAHDLQLRGKLWRHWAKRNGCFGALLILTDTK